MPKRIVVGISGASGVTYGVRLLSLLEKTDYESHLIISDSGRLNIKIETSYQPDEVEAMADYVYEHKDVAASLASGSFLTDGMVGDEDEILSKTEDFVEDLEGAGRDEGHAIRRGYRQL